MSNVTHTPAPPCTNGALRLADGTDKYSGRLEVCNGGQWGTVCGKDVSNDLATTACGLLGFGTKGKACTVYAHSIHKDMHKHNTHTTHTHTHMHN